jgi:DNA-binding response OmpR family regulator
VLVIDDEERLASTLKMALTHDYEVDIATRGRAAIELIAQKDYDAILCDLMLPDASGADIYEQSCRDRPALKDRFVFLTGGAFSGRARAFLQSVTNPRLEKPFDLDVLERVIAERVAIARRAT